METAGGLDWAQVGGWEGRLQGQGRVAVRASRLQLKGQPEGQGSVSMAAPHPPHDLLEGRCPAQSTDDDKMLVKPSLSAAGSKHFIFISSRIHTLVHKLSFTPILQIEKETY